MNEFVMIVFIFGIGAFFGWTLEVFYRHFTDKNKSWVNPGFCVGPWLPIYGEALVVVFFITYLNQSNFIGNELLTKFILFIFVGLCITMLELISGIVLLKYFNMRLWDYSNEKYNLHGFICIKYTIYWIILAAIMREYLIQYCGYLTI